MCGMSMNSREREKRKYKLLSVSFLLRPIVCVLTSVCVCELVLDSR